MKRVCDPRVLLSLDRTIGNHAFEICSKATLMSVLKRLDSFLTIHLFTIVSCASKIFQERYQSVKRLGSRSETTGPNCLQRLSADRIKSLLQINKKLWSVTVFTILICLFRKKGFGHLFIFVIKALTNTDVSILRIQHQPYEIDRPKGHWSEVVVDL